MNDVNDVSETKDVPTPLHQESVLEENNTPLVLTERDLEVMKLCHEERFLLFSQIRDTFWPGRNEEANATYRRIRRMVEEGYLRKEWIKKRTQNLLLLAERGHRALQDKNLHGALELYRYSEVHDGPKIDHGLKVTNIRLLFRALGLSDWTSERMLYEREQKSFCPDGVINVRGNKIAIEFENGLKWKRRYVNRFATYADLSNEYMFVIYVVAGDVREWLVDLEYKKSQVCFVEYNYLMQNKEKSKLENKTSGFVLAEIL